MHVISREGEGGGEVRTGVEGWKGVVAMKVSKRVQSTFRIIQRVSSFTNALCRVRNIYGYH